MALLILLVPASLPAPDAPLARTSPSLFLPSGSQPQSALDGVSSPLSLPQTSVSPVYSQGRFLHLLSDTDFLSQFSGFPPEITFSPLFLPRFSRMWKTSQEHKTRSLPFVPLLCPGPEQFQVKFSCVYEYPGEN